MTTYKPAKYPGWAEGELVRTCISIDVEFVHCTCVNVRTRSKGCQAISRALKNRMLQGNIHTGAEEDLDREYELNKHKFMQ